MSETETASRVMEAHGAIEAMCFFILEYHKKQNTVNRLMFLNGYNLKQKNTVICYNTKYHNYGIREDIS